MTKIPIFNYLWCIFVITTIKQTTPISITEDSVCFKEECLQSAFRILKNMDTRVDPCDNFYKFACGFFVSSTVIPANKPRVDMYGILNDELNQQISTLIEQKINDDEPRPFKLAKSLYQSCMDETNIEKHGLAPLLDNLKHLGGWPVLEGDTWNESTFDWKETIYKLREMGYPTDYIIHLNVVTDFNERTKWILQIGQVSLGFSQKSLVKSVKDKFVEAYYNYMVDIAVALGANRTRAKMELEESLEFETRLAKIIVPSHKLENLTMSYNLMTIKELQTTYPSIPWKDYINTILPETVQVDEDEVVIVKVPQFIASLEDLLQNTPKRILANYIIWRVVQKSIQFLNKQVTDRRQQMLTTLSVGLTKAPPRKMKCTETIIDNLSLIVGSMYVRKFFQERTKQEALDMVIDIREAFIDILEKVDWMDEETKDSAIDKARSMEFHVGYPNELLDDTKIDEVYAKLTMDSNAFLGKYLEVQRCSANYKFEQLRKLVREFNWQVNDMPAVANAYYLDSMNSLSVPAGILQSVFFHIDRPKYMNYGAIGGIIGHEITHGFDNKGCQYDKDGYFKDWWKSDTKEKYLKKVQCIVNQYGQYTVEPLNVQLNGYKTRDENIADNGAVKQAYIAYNNWVKRHGVESRLPGLKKYSPNQMFWISWANNWCMKARPKDMKNQIDLCAHSPGEFRVVGPLSNMPEFAADFNCPENSRMNPKNKCIIW